MAETLVITQRDLVVPVMIDGKPVSTGFQRAYLQSLQLYDLKRIVLFLLQENLISRPDMFRRFEEVKELDGSNGREILIHTLLHEPPPVIEMAYELVSRVQPEGSFQRKKAKAKNDVESLLNNAAAKKKKTNKSEGEDDDADADALSPTSEAASPSSGAPDLRQHIAFQQMLPAIREQARTDWLAAHPGGASSSSVTPEDEELFADAVESKAISAFKIRMEGKLSALENDPDVYVKWPRVHMPPPHGEVADADKESVVGLVAKPVKLCGEQISHLMSNLAKAEGGDYGEFEDERQELGHKRRELCMFDPTLPLNIANIIRLRLDPTFYDKKNPFEENMALANVQYAARRKRETEQDKKRAEDRAAKLVKHPKRRPKAPRTPKDEANEPKEEEDEVTQPHQELVEEDENAGGPDGITPTD